MSKINNYKWLNLIPCGWSHIGKKMIEECEAIEPNYTITDMKEKWGELRVVSYIPDKERWPTPSDYADKLTEIEDKCTEQSIRTCCVCGAPAVKISTGYILPFCDKCGKDEEKYYKRFKKE